MLDKKTRVQALLDAAIQEMELIVRMSERVSIPSDFGATMDGLIIFRACGMGLQYVTESFVKIRNQPFFHRVSQHSSRLLCNVLPTSRLL